MGSHALWQTSLVLASLIPAGFALSALFVSRRSPFRVAYLVSLGTVGLSVVALVLRTVVSFLTDGGPGPILRNLVQLDLTTRAMLLLVCALAVVVIRYSQSYLAGEADLVRYARSLVMTLASVTLLVLSNHLGLLAAAWLATGIGLHQLLVFYRRRRQAVIVAHKTFLLARFADLAFLAALVLVEGEVGSLHIDAVNAFAGAHESLSPGLHLATVLLVFGVLLKTAQLPFHGWILQVMEAPTPVSALLHAGVVNIGGFVMIRLSPLMARASIAQSVLLGVGLVTAIVASLVTTTRATIKISLAWSTIGQMGFMLVQCGLGVWHLALLHLLAHSLYKAHAFLSAGSVVEAWRGASLVQAARPTRVFMAAGAGLLCVAAAPLYAVFALGPLRVSTSFGVFALSLGLSFVPMIARALSSGRRVAALVALASVGAAVSYFVWHFVFEHVASSLDGDVASSFDWTVVVLGLVVLFVAQTVLQVNPGGRLARFLHPHFLSGLYIDDWFTRLTFRLWPPRLERPAGTSRRSSVLLENR